MRSDVRRMTGINQQGNRIIMDTCTYCEFASVNASAVSALSGDYAQSHKYSVYHPPYVPLSDSQLAIRILQIL